MEINEAALRLKAIEVIEAQVKFLRDSAEDAGSYDYANRCNAEAKELLTTLASLVSPTI